MFRYALVLVLAVALIEARPGKGSRSGSGSKSKSGSNHGSGSNSESGSYSGEVLGAADFHDELQTVKDTAVAMSEAIHNVKGLATKAMADPSGEGWEEFGLAMEDTFTEVAENFDTEIHRVSKLAEALWFDENDLEKDTKCGFVAGVDAHKEDLEHLEIVWAMAMIEDLACMAGEFKQAENIPFDLLTDDVHEDTAIEIVQSVLWEMHKIGRAGELFGESMKNIAEYLEAPEEASEEVTTEEPTSSESNEKRDVERLIRLLKKFTK